MNVCPCCGQPLLEPPPCEVAGCLDPQIYEGWHRTLDPLSGQPTGHIRLLRVCEAHVTLLIGKEVPSERQA